MNISNNCVGFCFASSTSFPAKLFLRYSNALVGLSAFSYSGTRCLVKYSKTSSFSRYFLNSSLLASKDVFFISGIFKGIYFTTERERNIHIFRYNEEWTILLLLNPSTSKLKVNSNSDFLDFRFCELWKHENSDFRKRNALEKQKVCLQVFSILWLT